jgi:3-deoxy-7-phosphoheptulonate synthase
MAREADPERLVQAYFHSAATLNLQRAFVHGGYADLHQVHVWNKEFVSRSPLGNKYEQLAQKIDEALVFMKACGVTPENNRDLRETDLYISHEALLLPYEEALTRCDSLSGKWYNCGTHLVWLGVRTNQPDGAHVEFCRGIHNPIGVKVGPDNSAEEIRRVLDKLNPDNQRGRINLITRFGYKNIRKKMPGLVKAIHADGRKLLWSCDPMHGNTYISSNKLKTRDFDHIIAEIKEFFRIHAELGTVPGGVHFELTGEDVTEIRGGAQKIDDRQLPERYYSNCDPRLNGQQSLEMAFEIAEMLRQWRD